MTNLAGHPQAHETCCAELGEAGVRTYPVDFKHMGPEVPARVVGVITHADGNITVLSRLWYYWVTRSTSPLMIDPGNGSEIRVDGYAGGIPFNPETGCKNFHVDTAEGLKQLVTALTAYHGADTGRTPTWEEVRPLLNDAVFQEAVIK